MVRLKNWKYPKGKRPNYWWRCSREGCDVRAAEHPNGTLMSTPADTTLKQLRIQAHRRAELIWGEWKAITRDQKKVMYDWLEKNTTSHHIGHMQEDEVKDLIKRFDRIINTLKELENEDIKPIGGYKSSFKAQENNFARKRIRR